MSRLLPLLLWLGPVAAAELRVVWAAPEAGTVELTASAGGATLAHLAGQPAPAATDWFVCPAGPVTLRVAAATGEELFGETLSLPAAGRWTRIIYRRLGEPAGLLLDDTPPAVAPGQAALRLVHAVPDAERLEAIIKQPRGRLWPAVGLGPAVAYGAATAYAPLAPGPLTLVLTDPAENAEILTLDGLRALVGAVYTGVVSGVVGAAGDDERPVSLLTLVDRLPVGE